MSDLGRWLLFAGLGLAAVGGLLWLASAALPGLRLGRLPGDILIQRDGFTFYLPLTTMVVLSVLLTALFSVVRWLAR